MGRAENSEEQQNSAEAAEKQQRPQIWFCSQEQPQEEADEEAVEEVSAAAKTTRAKPKLFLWQTESFKLWSNNRFDFVLVLLFASLLFCFPFFTSPLFFCVVSNDGDLQALTLTLFREKKTRPNRAANACVGATTRRRWRTTTTTTATTKATATTIKTAPITRFPAHTKAVPVLLQVLLLFCYFVYQAGAAWASLIDQCRKLYFILKTLNILLLKDTILIFSITLDTFVI